MARKALKTKHSSAVDGTGMSERLALAELRRTTGSLQAVLCQKCKASVCEGIFIQSEKGGGVREEGVGMSGCDMTNIRCVHMES